MNFRKHGKEPFTVVVVHGGPGAAGEVRPVAEKLSEYCGVLEPLQTASSVEGQVQELRSILEENGAFPMIVIGYSWGAWLAYMLAARYPDLVRKLILVSSGPFEAAYAEDIMKIRLSRLSGKERLEAQELLQKLDDPHGGNEDVLERFERIISKTEIYDPIPDQKEEVDIRQGIYQSVWPEAAELRRSGHLLRMGEQIQCPVLAIHGDYDPHPAEGVQEPLSTVIRGDFRFILLEHCGHKPWIEQEARDRFFAALRAECVHR